MNRRQRLDAHALDLGAKGNVHVGHPGQPSEFQVSFVRYWVPAEDIGSEIRGL